MVKRKKNTIQENEAPFKKGYKLDINKFYKADRWRIPNVETPQEI